MLEQQTFSTNEITSLNSSLIHPLNNVNTSGIIPPIATPLKTSADLPLPKADLTVTSSEKLMNFLSVDAGGMINIKYDLRNQGNLKATRTRTKFYLSKDELIDNSDNYLGSKSSVAVSSNSFISESINLRIDRNLSGGNYYIIAKADDSNVVAESREDNNTTPIPITVNKVDLTITDTTNLPTLIISGNNLNFTYRIENQGMAVSRVTRTIFYLSKDGSIDKSDIIIGSDLVEALNPLTGRSETVSLPIIGNWYNFKPGTMFLLMRADATQTVAESDESNNVTAKQISIIDGKKYSSVNGYGLVNASAAVASAIGAPSFPKVTTLEANNWGANLINAPSAWAKGYTGFGVIVAVLDTGVDRTHSDLGQNIWINNKEIAGNGIDDDQNGFVDDVYGWNFVEKNNNTMDFHSHGTHVAGTIAALNNGIGATGIAYNAKIMPIKVIGNNGNGEEKDVALGVRYAADNGARVINLSIGGNKDEPDLRAAIEYASKKGAIVVMAAGNSGQATILNNYPSAYATEWGIAVGAVNSANVLAGWSNRAGTVKIPYVTAPGVNIYSTLPGNRYGFKSGTSMATPHVAGLVALMLSANPNLTEAQVREIIASSADNSLTITSIAS
ncbi:MAG: hypothetical protein N5P05_002179 [Chroococcopsis gigantea SAG 12.99]|jgi:hypothetical protein|nr:S8 family serine peptidase [Chlorogloea purpurea SAG 13.99]MDV3000573.1 hypothetical protein [Chroococcopsis gigantea SAG 12.99]